MKKTLVLLTALLTVSLAWAQTLPDGGFEEWKTGKTHEGTTYDDLANPFWQTLNVLSTLPPEMGTGPVVVFKEQGQHGYCPKMESNELTLGEKTIFLPGVVGAITVIIDKQTAQFGRPYTGRPEALKGVMRYKPVNNDSAAIFVEVYKTSESGQRQMITRNEVIYKESVADWTEFNIPLDYLSDETPDSICVLFVSSAGYDFEDLFNCKGQIGSTLWVDDCRFVIDGNDPGVPGTDPGTANETANMLNVNVYPNPATDVLNVTVEENAQLTVFDQAGRVLLQQPVQAGENALNIAELKAGFYTFRVTGAQKNGSGKFIKR
ncbi:MAG: PCMD domain-containing protein [Bacteroidales bacterium]|nr:PCMD domain-containing protein [Bacteroidales bacterium]